MEKVMKCFLVFLLYVFCSNNLYADCVKYYCEEIKVTALMVNRILVGIGTSGDEDNLMCDSNKFKYLYLKRTHDNFDAIYSLVLAAHVSGENIYISTNRHGPCDVRNVISTISHD